jgi:hypothetical protein
LVISFYSIKNQSFDKPCPIVIRLMVIQTIA